MKVHRYLYKYGLQCPWIHLLSTFWIKPWVYICLSQMVFCVQAELMFGHEFYDVSPVQCLTWPYRHLSVPCGGICHLELLSWTVLDLPSIRADRTCWYHLCRQCLCSVFIYSWTMNFLWTTDSWKEVWHVFFKYCSNFSLELACNCIIAAEACTHDTVSVHSIITKWLVDQCELLADMGLFLHLPKQRCPKRHKNFAFFPAAASLCCIMSLLLFIGDSTYRWHLSVAEIVEGCQAW